MGDRFATPEDVLRHWRLEEGDPFRIAETKDEAANRRSTVWRREERASDVELVGEALVVARMHYPDSGRYRWSVFDPDGLLIARGEKLFDRNTKKSAFIGEMRDGRRITGQWADHFVQNAVWQHRIAQLEPTDRDPLWIYYLDHRPIVHGTVKNA